LHTLDEIACSSVGGGGQDPKVTLAGGGLILGAVEVGKAAVVGGVTAGSAAGCGVLVVGGGIAAGGGFLIGTYIEEQTGIGATVGGCVGSALGYFGICW
jgi:hypothetical protein